MKKFLSHIVAGILGLAIASWLFPVIKIRTFYNSSFFGIPLTERWHVIVLLGILLGILVYFVRPILKTITLPLRIITLGLFNFVIDMALIWILDVLFEEITIPWFWPLFWTTLIVLALDLILQKSSGKPAAEV
jgi:putative membrane protein